MTSDIVDPILFVLVIAAIVGVALAVSCIPEP